MNKSELINAMSAESGLSKTDAKKALDASERAGRTGINPATKQPIEIPAKKVVKFKPGAELELE